MRQQRFRLGQVHVLVQEFSEGAIVKIEGLMEWIHDSFEDALAALSYHAARFGVALVEGW